MLDIATRSLQKFQSFFERLQGRINKKVNLNLVAIEVKKEVNGIVSIVFKLRKEVEETVCVEIEIKEKIKNLTTFGIKQEVEFKLQNL